MKKRILLIGHTSSRSALRLKEEADSLGIILDAIKTSDIKLEGDSLIIENVEVKFSPLDYDIYFFRGVSRSLERMQEVAKFLGKKSKRVVEEILITSTLPEDKRVHESIAGSYLLPEQKIMLAKDITKDTVDEFPVVLKKASSSMGKGVAKISSVNELLEFINELEGEVFVQKYYPIEFDVRILIVGEKIIGAFSRYKPEGEDFLTTRKGGRREVFTLSEEMKSAALEAKKLQGLEIAGIDMFVFEGKPYIFEVNASPQIPIFEEVTGKNAAREIIQYLIS